MCHMRHANWFIGWPADAWAPADAVPRMQHDLALPPSTRWMSGDDLHVTLAFLGRCGEQAADRAFDLAAQQARIQPPKLSLSAHGWALLGGDQAPSAVSLLMEGGSADLSTRIAELRPALYAAADARPDTRPPRPHVTLARLNRQVDNPTRQALAQRLHRQVPPPFTLQLESLALFTWTEDRVQRLFRRTRHCPLGRPAP